MGWCCKNAWALILDKLNRAVVKVLGGSRVARQAGRGRR